MDGWTPENVQSLLNTLAALENLALIIALGTAFIWGALLWRLIILAKNQRHFW